MKSSNFRPAGSDSQDSPDELIADYAGMELDDPPSSQRAKRWCKSRDYRMGPACLDEIWQWPTDQLEQIARRGLLGEFTMTLEQGVCLHTSYSGMGVPEQSAAMLQAAAGSTKPFRVHRACDFSATCRRILNSFPRTHRAHYVAKDLLDMVSIETIAEMQRVLKSAKAEYQERRQAGEVKRKFVGELWARVQKDMTDILSQLDWSEPKARCDGHDGRPIEHPWWWDGFEVGGTELVGEVAGTVCVAWSSMGSGSGWLAASCIPFFIWLSLVVHKRPHFIIHECTPRFEIEIFQKALGTWYDIQTICLSPTDLGIPASRDRRYTVMLLKTALAPVMKLDSAEFKDMFYRRVAIPGSVFMDSLQEDDWQAYIKELASAQRLPEKDVTGPWPLDAVLPAGMATRRAAWNDWAAQHGVTTGLCDANHHASFIGNVLQPVPALLQSSMIHVVSDRVFHPLEHFGPIGLPVLAKDRISAGNLGGLIPAELLASMSTRELKSVTGNAMHAACVGLMILYVTSCTEKLERLRQPRSMPPSTKPTHAEEKDDDDRPTVALATESMEV